MPAARAQLVLHDEHGRFIEAALNVFTDDAGRFRVTRAGGTVRAFALRAGEASPPSAPIELDPEHPARVELQLAPATTLRVEVANGPALDADLEISARDEHGLEHALDAFPGAFHALERPEPTLPGHTLGPLPPGRYRIEASTLDGRRAATELELAGQPTERVVLTLGR